MQYRYFRAVPAPPYTVVTGAAGFIGSALVTRLNRAGHKRIVLVDAFGREGRSGNWEGKAYALQVERDAFPEWLEAHAAEVGFVYHLGARTDTAEFDKDLFDRLNSGYSKRIWRICAEARIPLVYASSAATYGDGSQGYADDPDRVPSLQPLNPYGESKQEMDRWVLEQDSAPPQWAGIKFFNVYGPNEYHKGRMASVVFHAYRQIQERGWVGLFRSYHPDYADGQQMRDFVYVLDVVKVLAWFREHPAPNGFYNLGTGEARSFYDLASAVFAALDRKPDIRFIDMPEDIRANYQYHTEATMTRLRAAGYAESFRSLEAGIRDYVRNYLVSGRFY
jgi:ADP-L-glycero-D-manno-heptose 6-epimerase